jgi:hypothetical protein
MTDESAVQKGGLVELVQSLHRGYLTKRNLEAARTVSESQGYGIRGHANPLCTHDDAELYWYRQVLQRQPSKLCTICKYTRQASLQILNSSKISNLYFYVRFPRYTCWGTRLFDADGSGMPV